MLSEFINCVNNTFFTFILLYKIFVLFHNINVLCQINRTFWLDRLRHMKYIKLNTNFPTVYSPYNRHLDAATNRQNKDAFRSFVISTRLAIIRRFSFVPVHDAAA